MFSGLETAEALEERERTILKFMSHYNQYVCQFCNDLCRVRYP